MATSPRVYQGYHPTSEELGAAPGAIADLGRFTGYSATLGPLAPAASTVVSALALAVAWRKARGPAEAWDEYVRTEDGLAWKGALMLLDRVKPYFLAAVQRNSELAQQYPGLARMFEAPREVAKQALATKKKNAAAVAASAASATATAAPAVTAVAAAPDASTTPARVVTVQG